MQENIPHQNLTTAAFAAALEQERGKGGDDGLGRMLSPTEMGIKTTATMDMPPDYETIMDGLLPGQNVVGNGTTVYNPNRSDPRVERIMGEARYKSKKPENSVDSMRVKMVELQNKLDQVTAMVANKPVPEPVKTEEQIAEEQQGGMTEAEFRAMSYQDLIKLAKSLAIPGLKGISKEDCLQKILEMKAR